MRTFRAVVGAPQWPTPHGLFAVSERVPQPNPKGFLGPSALHLTAFSNKLIHFDGGPGTVAIHGRGGASLLDPLGTARSHGCIRITNRAIDYIEARAVKEPRPDRLRTRRLSRKRATAVVASLRVMGRLSVGCASVQSQIHAPPKSLSGERRVVSERAPVARQSSPLLERLPASPIVRFGGGQGLEAENRGLVLRPLMPGAKKRCRRSDQGRAPFYLDAAPFLAPGAQRPTSAERVLSLRESNDRG